MSDEHTTCRFGWWGWSLAFMLACYVLFMHSLWSQERHELVEGWNGVAMTKIRRMGQDVRKEFHDQLWEEVSEFRNITSTLLAQQQSVMQDANVLTRYQCAAPDVEKLCSGNGWRK